MSQDHFNVRALVSALASLVLILTGCKSLTSKKTEDTAPKATWVSPEQAITVMTFNVENLFDTKDDAKKSDETFLPLSLKSTPSHQKKCASYKQKKWKEECLHFDWNEDVLIEKLRRLAQVIRSARVDQSGPHLLMLQEIENKSVLERLVREHLSDLKYQVVLIEGQDQRGIDVAMLSRLPLKGKPKLHPIPFKNIPNERRKDTRGILEAHWLLPDQSTLVAYSVHFPAPFHPRELREQAFEHLNQLKKIHGEHVHTIAAGDFNVPSEENNTFHLLERLVHPQWLVAHQLGCEACQGTNYYAPKDSWSFLDMILLDKKFYDGERGWKVLRKSVRLVNQGHPEQLTAEGRPQSFYPQGLKGVSDHWPLAVDIMRAQ